MRVEPLHRGTTRGPYVAIDPDAGRVERIAGRRLTRTRVLLDGVEVHGAVAADEEQGIVWVLPRSATDRSVFLFLKDPTDKRFGVVVRELRGEVKIEVPTC